MGEQLRGRGRMMMTFRWKLISVILLSLLQVFWPATIIAYHVWASRRMEWPWPQGPGTRSCGSGTKQLWRRQQRGRLVFSLFYTSPQQQQQQQRKHQFILRIYKLTGHSTRSGVNSKLRQGEAFNKHTVVVVVVSCNAD